MPHETNRPNYLFYKDPREVKKALDTHLAAKEEVKKEYLERIRKFYADEKSRNPNFKLSGKNIKEYITQNPEMFPGISSTSGLLFYFNKSLASLEIAMGIRSVNE